MNSPQPPLQSDADARPGARPKGAPTDARRARRRQERQLLALAIAVLVVVGGALIALIYGPGALITALPCLLAGAGAILILYLLFLLTERWVNR
jgi:polyferredoxin